MNRLSSSIAGSLAGLATVAFVSAVALSEDSQAIEARVRSLIGSMTLQEKVSMVTGVAKSGYTGYVNSIPRLGIPALRLTDGPVGVRVGNSTAFPASIASASTWNTDLVYRLGQALGRETKAKGQDVLLGPCINILRVPMGGRSFEGFGEDPFLTSQMTVPYIKGVQSQGVIADVKHYAVNNQEEQRGTINTIVDERTLREIYLPGFRAAVQDAGVLSVMAAYNKLNGVYCSQNDFLLKDVLKGDWGFKGFVVSDWGATHSTLGTANGGMDLEMPTGTFWGSKLTSAVKNGSVSEATLDDMASRVLYSMAVSGLLDKNPLEKKEQVSSAENRQIALDLAREGIVLLKNNGVLPLAKGAIKSIAVIGPNAAVLRTGGGGSAYVSPTSAVSPLDALEERAVSAGISVSYTKGSELDGDPLPIPSSLLSATVNNKTQQGLKADYFNNMTLAGKPILTRVDKDVDFNWGDGAPDSKVNTDGFSVRWTGKFKPKTTGRYGLSVSTDDGVRFYIDGKQVINNWGDHATETRTVSIDLTAGRSYDIKLEYYENGGLAEARLGWIQPDEKPFSEAVRIAKQADVAVVYAGLDSSLDTEGMDRKDLRLPGGQDSLISAVAAANPRTIVVLNNGSAVLMDPWLDKVSAVLEAWYPGQEGARAMAEILFGDINPSGKLPMTFPKSWSDCAAFGNYPGSGGKVTYKEGIFVGYRHFDTHKIEPLFPFGYGLSYTAFKYSDIKVQTKQLIAGETSYADGSSPGPGSIVVTAVIENTGKRSGSEVAQLYVRDIASSADRPEKELKAFQKVTLAPGEKETVTFTLDPSSFAFYSIDKHKWFIEPGDFDLLVGSSSRDIRLSERFTIN